MDFLARFKGRTNFLSKTGLNSLMSESSIPILKVHSQPDSYSNPDGYKKPRGKNLKPYATEEQFSPVRSHLMENDDRRMVPLRNGRNVVTEEQFSPVNNRHFENEDRRMMSLRQGQNNYGSQEQFSPMKQRTLENEDRRMISLRQGKNNYVTEEQYSPMKMRTQENEDRRMVPLRNGRNINMNHYRKPSSEADLYIETEPQFYHHGGQDYYRPHHHEFLTPQHAYPSRRDSEEGPEYNFTRRVNQLTVNTRMTNNNSPMLRQTNNMVAQSPISGNKQTSNLLYKPQQPQQPKNPYSVRPGFQFNGDLSPASHATHESRLNKIGYLERQQKVLSKYKPNNTNKQNEGYSQKYLNRSADTRHALMNRY